MLILAVEEWPHYFNDQAKLKGKVLKFVPFHFQLQFPPPFNQPSTEWNQDQWQKLNWMWQKQHM